MKQYFVIAVIAAALLLPTAAAATGSRQDVAVYTAVMEYECSLAAKHPELGYSIVQPQTDVLTPFSPYFQGHKLNKLLLKSLGVRNRTTHKIQKLNSCASLKFVAGFEVTSSFSWRRFHRRFPKAYGIFSMSAPGYSPGGDTAIIQVSNSCDSLCASGSYWLLHKVKGRWMVVAKSQPWVS